MKFDIEAVLGDMANAIKDEAKAVVGDMKDYAETILKKEAQSLKELAEARLKGQIDDKILERELAREKKVVQAEMMTIQLMTEAAAQKAVNAAIKVFVDALKTAAGLI